MSVWNKHFRLGSISWQRALPYVLLIGGIIGLLASLALTYDKIQALQDPDYNPTCNINPILSCGSVMQTDQATLLGMPNTIFGLIAFSMLIAFAFLLIAGAQTKRWVWIGAQMASTIGVVFMLYLFFESVFRIRAICPWCFVVWMITIAIFWGITVYNIRNKYLGLEKFSATRMLGAFISTHSSGLLILWYLVILSILLVSFWHYWSTLLP